MRYFILFSFLILANNTAIAQSITISPLTKTSYCVGDPLTVSYQASGTFEYNNSFFVQLSDANGSFKTFSSLGRSISGSGSITITLKNSGEHYRVRVASGAPYVYSADNGADVIIEARPTPLPSVHKTRGRIRGVVGGLQFPVVGLVGDSIQLVDRHADVNVSTRSWDFEGDASVGHLDVDSAVVYYPTEGAKIAALHALNPIGCDSIARLTYRIASCNPVIPKEVHVVTGADGTWYPSVWVKAGGSYGSGDDDRFQTVFVESGGSLKGTHDGVGLYYLKAGSSYSEQGGDPNITLILTPQIGVPFSSADTLQCPDLTFDYSQVSGDIKEEQPQSRISIRQTSDHLFARAKGESIELRLINLLGKEVLSQRGTDELDVDLSSLPKGIYIAIVESGSERLTKKIAVVQ